MYKYKYRKNIYVEFFFLIIFFSHFWTTRVYLYNSLLACHVQQRTMKTHTDSLKWQDNFTASLSRYTYTCIYMLVYMYIYVHIPVELNTRFIYILICIIHLLYIYSIPIISQVNIGRILPLRFFIFFFLSENFLYLFI